MAMFNKLTPAQVERLAILSEECGEVVQAVGKILRHGYESVDPTFSDPSGDTRALTNQEMLEKECGDVIFAINLLKDDIYQPAVGRRVMQKAEKIQPYLHHQS